MCSMTNSITGALGVEKRRVLGSLSARPPRFPTRRGSPRIASVLMKYKVD